MCLSSKVLMLLLKDPPVQFFLHKLDSVCYNDTFTDFASD
jgi:hypothetical protein